METIHVTHLHPKRVPTFERWLGAWFSRWEVIEMCHPAILFFDIQVMHHLDPNTKSVSDSTPNQATKDFFEKRVVIHRISFLPMPTRE
jgi:hypothetical protein